jgi:hypothetical protein
MTTTSASGTRVPQSTDAFSPTTQLKTLVDDEAPWNYFRIVDADSDRTSLASPELRDGIHCYVLATRILWRYDDSAWTQLTGYSAAGRQATSAATATGDLDSGVTFAALPFATVVELRALVMFDLTGSPPSARTASIAFSATAGTLTSDNAVGVMWPASVSTNDGARTAFQTASLALPASTAATVKLTCTISTAAPRANASAWYYVRRSA